MILVTGATGTIGRAVVEQLVAAGTEVRALTRDADRARFVNDSVKLVEGDLGSRATLSQVLVGIDRVFLLTGGGPETPLHDANMALAAADAGVRHIVKLSVIGAEYGFEDLVSSWHLAGERTLRQIGRRAGGPTWTFVRSGEFMSNAKLWAGSVKGKDTVFWAQIAPKVAVIDPADVAALSVHALTTPGHEGKAYCISGPEALSVSERVTKLSKALGRPIKLVELPVADVAAAAERAGRQSLVVETRLGELGREEYRQHAAAALLTFEDVVGRKPRTFDEWLSENIGIFR